MKKLAFIFLLGGIFLASCSKMDFEEPPSALLTEEENSDEAIRIGGELNEPTVIHISCVGFCDSNIPCGTLTTSTGSIVCSCSGCLMKIEDERTKRAYTPEELDALLDKRNLFEDQLNSYLQEKYSSSDYEINGVELSLYSKKDYSVLYEYSVPGQGNETVLFGITGGAGPALTVDCEGTCDCREEYTPGNPPHIECTCNECTMHIKHRNDEN